MWIARNKLTAPALLPDGRIDVVLADEQLPVVARRSPPEPRRRLTIRRDDAEVADRSESDRKPIAVIAPDELPHLAVALRLDRGQTAALNRWFQGRRTA
jgi:hypothetical protein